MCGYSSNYRSSTQVSLKAREVLILVQMPSFDERFVQMESILKAAVASSFGGHAGER
jgi:acetyl-CoA carboxylase/biotin carboxylase 1